METAKISMRDIMEALPVLNKLIDTEMSGRLALRTARLARALNNEIESVNSATKKVFDRYAEVPEPSVDEEGKEDTGPREPVVPKDKEEAFQADIDEILDEVAEISIPWLTVGDIESFDTIRAGDVYLLLPFIEESPD